MEEAMKTIKGATILLAAALGFAATHALADNTMPAPKSQAVKLSDAELDNITAGSATVITQVVNPGNAFVLRYNEGFTNVHVVGLPEGVENPFDGGKFRFIMITNPALTVLKCAGSIGGVSVCP
jgi:hypothetical protein